MTKHISRMNLESARDGIRFALKNLSASCEVLTDALDGGDGIGVEVAARVYHRRSMVAVRRLQTIYTRSRFGWEKSFADDILSRIAIRFNTFDYEIDAEPHLPKEWT